MAVYDLTLNDDVLTGTGGDDNFQGPAGGTDSLAGGAGNDTFDISESGQSQSGAINGGDGIDTLKYGYLHSITVINVEILDSAQVSGRLLEIAAFDSIVNSADPTGMIEMYGYGPVGSLDLSTRMLSNSVLFRVFDQPVVLTGTNNNDVVQGSYADDTIHGAGGDDTITSGGGADAIYGDAGNDQLASFVQGGILDGGEGDDVLTVSSSNATVIGGAGTDTVNSIDLGTATFESVEALNAEYIYGTIAQLSSFATSGNWQSPNQEFRIWLNGAGGTLDLANRLVTNRAIIIEGGYLTTGLTIVGSSNDDKIYATPYRDVLGGGEANDQLNGYDGNDELSGGGGNDVLGGGFGEDRMFGGLGDDTYAVDDVGDVVIELANQGTDLVFSSITLNVSKTHIENVTLTGSNAANAIGNGLANVLTGNEAANALNGGTGADMMQGGLGNDTYYVDQAGDVVKENDGGGTDTVLSTITYSAMSSFVENITLQGNENISAAGNALNNTLTGNAAKNTLQGSTGADKLIGGGSRDILNPGNDRDADRIEIGAISDSSGVSRDLVVDMDWANEDKFHFAVNPTSIQKLFSGTVNEGAGFEAGLKALLDPIFDAGSTIQGVLLDLQGGTANYDLTAYLVIDANNDGNYTAAADYVVECFRCDGTLDVSDFV